MSGSRISYGTPPKISKGDITLSVRKEYIHGNLLQSTVIRQHFVGLLITIWTSKTLFSPVKFVLVKLSCEDYVFTKRQTLRPGSSFVTSFPLQGE